MTTLLSALGIAFAAYFWWAILRAGLSMARAG
jgi:hypothetical protein